MAIEPERLDQSGRELAATLKQLRVQAGLSGVRLALRCNMSQSKISRIEGNKCHPSLLDVEQLLRALDAAPDVAARVMDLAQITQTEWQDGRALRRRGIDKKQIQLAGIEASTTNFRYFMLSMITGLLATPEYVRASLSLAPPEQQAKAVAMKLDRQKVLFDPSKNFTFLMTEHAVRYPLVAPGLMALQMDRLASLTHQSNIRIGLLPADVHFSSGALNTFSVYDETLATAELDLGAIVFRDRRDVQDLLRRFARYESHALFGESARNCLTIWAEHCRR